jgi:hypothetical protein
MKNPKKTTIIIYSRNKTITFHRRVRYNKFFYNITRKQSWYTLTLSRPPSIYVRPLPPCGGPIPKLKYYLEKDISNRSHKQIQLTWTSEEGVWLEQNITLRADVCLESVWLAIPMPQASFSIPPPSPFHFLCSELPTPTRGKQGSYGQANDGQNLGAYYHCSCMAHLAKDMMNLALEASLFTLRGYFLHAVKSHNMGPTVSLPLRRKWNRP